MPQTWLERLESDGWVSRQQKKKNLDEQKKDFLDFQNRRNDYILTYSSEAGQRVLMDRIERASILMPFDTYNAQIYEKEGQRKEVLNIMAHIPKIAGLVIYKLCEQVEKRIEKNMLEMGKQIDDLKE